MESKLGYGFGAGACIQWLQVMEILLVCTYSPTHSFLFKRLMVSTIHLFSDFIYQATMLFSPFTFPQSTALLALQLHSAGLPFSPFPTPPVFHQPTPRHHLSFCPLTHMPTPPNPPHRFQRPNIPTPGLLVRTTVNPPYLSPALPLHVILHQGELGMSPGKNALIRSCWSNLCSWA